jgi:phenylacetate-CoA ligase
MNDRYWDRAAETMPVNELKQLQLAKLRSIVAYSYNNSPYYRELYDAAKVRPDDIKSLDDLRRLPTICKCDLRKDIAEHPKFGRILAVPEEDVVYVACSSGTTGRPLVSPFTKEGFEEIIDVSSRFFYGQGMRRGDRHIHCLNLSLFVASPAVLAIERVGAMCLWGGVIAMERTFSMLQSLQITSLLITPSFAWRLGHYIMEQYGVDPAKDLFVRRITVAGEPGGSVPEIRKSIEELWGAKVYEVYGLSEIMGCLAASCEEQDGLHLAEDHIFVETLDPKTHEPLPDGEEGEFVFTALDKQGHPMIRYRSGDIGVVDRTPCRCGRTSARLRIVGRKGDMFIVSGVNVYPEDVHAALLTMKGITGEFLIHLRTKHFTTCYDVEIERASGNTETDEELAARVSDNLKHILAARPHSVIVRQPGEIKQPEGQKARYVVDERENGFKWRT